MKMSLEAYRVNKGMTQRDLAKALGVSPQTILNWEHGKGLDVPRLVKMCAFYGIEVSDVDFTPFLCPESLTK